MTRLKCKLDAVYLEIVLILTQDRCTICTEHTKSSEIILDAPDGTPSNVGHVQYRFGPFGDSDSFDARKVHGFCQVYQMLRNHFRCT